MKSYIEIHGRRIGPGYPTFVIAEMSANHNKSFDQAVDIIRAARKAGADAVKLQTYTADTMTIDSTDKHFQISGTPWHGRTLYELYDEASTPWDWQPRLMDVANDLGLHLFSTPFDHTAVGFLETMDLPAYKVASFEIVDLPLLRRIAQTGKPVIMSTGMATLGEIEEAVYTIRQAGASQLALLKCTSAYPAPPEIMNLRTIPHMAEAFNVPVGVSDHTLGTSVPVAAVALGACIIEKHFTLSRARIGPDSAFSLEPSEFARMVSAVRIAEKALGEVQYGVGELEADSRVFRRSLFVVRDMKSGEMFTNENLRSIRPGNGLHTRHFENVVGRHATREVKRGTPLSWELVGDYGDEQR